jgi:hypothetical protein
MAGSVSAQVDTTPPVLLDFKISPVLFDTSQGDVRIDFCVTAADDISGTSTAHVTAPIIPGTPVVNFGEATAPTESCYILFVPRGAAQGKYLIEITLYDRLGNQRIVSGEDLCALGFPCSIENKFLGSLPDADGDGVPDIADNCPNDPNPNQEDQDLDLIGDVCDPFPDDSDNDQAQCEADLAQCLAGLVPDQDGDGEADATDACPDTPEGAAVDQAGCSLAQFCAAIDATTADGAKVCKNSDWRNDEPLAASNKGDCRVEKGNSGRADDRCVPRL